ncbi:Egg cell-secreted protein 1.1 [Hibiscus syriacus]|uniref:Egg cell-secreted protein 1.1 n=1 Tax=Hibiscus syriacus TaxID=106335 RepID=A0A6A2Y902_HIBSY|nr:egg cell-secreted protein 1.1-like [Hibiscus syriacus]KAE8666484.1 Egg cell-secreted protein 1.1 [Hibiscus syriacus]
MAKTFNLSSALAVFLVLEMAFLTHARPLGTPKPTLAARLKLDADSPSCWESLTQIQSCSGEVILFFLNGETYLGNACCHAIHTISHQCWPDMMETLGYTTEEGDILEGYCDQEIADSPPSLPSVKAGVAVPAKGLLS